MSIIIITIYYDIKISTNPAITKHLTSKMIKQDIIFNKYLEFQYFIFNNVKQDLSHNIYMLNSTFNNQKTKHKDNRYEYYLDCRLM